MPQNFIKKSFQKLSNSKYLPALVIGSFFFLLFSILYDLKPSAFSLRLFGNKQQENQSSAKTFSDYLEEVAPESGYTVDIVWGDTGIKLVESGAIDLEKYRENYSGPEYQELLTYLTEYKDGGITITRENSYFWVNTLWALGLNQKSKTLDEGIMGTEYKDEVGSFASTGGWTLGKKDGEKLFSKANILPLTPEQHAHVMSVAGGIYRPCCNNPTSFPDCNHGMAILGLLELMELQGLSEDEMYRAALAFNSYWFTNTYTDLAYYFASQEGIPWSDVDPRVALGKNYSSSTGYQGVKALIGDIPGSRSQGGSCGA